MKIAAWNVNSINARLPTILKWFAEAEPDAACLQEIKCTDDKFPADAFDDLGYNVAVHGQKTYNGVAIVSKYPIEETIRGLPGADALAGEEGGAQARYLECVLAAPQGPVRLASIYLPNGNPAPGPKYDYKLSWFDLLIARARTLLTLEEPLMLAGDYNVIPRDEDCHDPAAWADDALALPQSRAKLRELMWLGFTSAFEQMDGGAHRYTFWDYQAGAWQKDNGIRIDHILCSPQAADRLSGFEIHKHARGWDKPSDHVPVLAAFDL